MWIFTTTGFYSVNRTPDGKRLQLRARVAADLDNFREKYCPDLGETIELPYTDYQFRAEVDSRHLGDALAAAVEDVDYKNFKNSVEDKSGDRHHAYMDVWEALYSHLGRRSG